MSLPARPRGVAAAPSQASPTVTKHTAPTPWSVASSLQPTEDLEWMDHGVGMLRPRILPPSGFGGYGSSSQDEFADSINSETVYTDLIGTQLSATVQDGSTQCADDTVPTAPALAPAPAKGNQKRSKNFSDEEDILLVSAWLNVSLDPINGVDQSRSKYWKRIHTYYHTNKNFDSDRSVSSLLNRWSGIQHDVNVFAGCLSKIEARNHSGWSIDDKHANACAMFKVEDKHHRNFPYMHCWKILKDQPKWSDRRRQLETPKPATKKQKVSEKSSPSAAIGATNLDDRQSQENAIERPAGKKKEKQNLRHRSTFDAMEFVLEKKKEADVEQELKKEERCKKVIAMQEEKIRFDKEKFEFHKRLEEQKFEFQKQLEEERIMNIDLSTLSYKQQQYYEGRQNEILASRMNN